MLHFTKICPNLVWFIAPNCHDFEKQQQIKRKHSAREKNYASGKKKSRTREKASLIQLVI